MQDRVGEPVPLRRGPNQLEGPPPERGDVKNLGKGGSAGGRVDEMAGLLLGSGGAKGVAGTSEITGGVVFKLDADITPESADVMAGTGVGLKEVVTGASISTKVEDCGLDEVK